MQGQKGVIGSLPESLALEHGSNSSESGVVEQQIFWTNFIQNPPTNANQETPNLSMWTTGESSSSQVDPKIGRGWSSVIKAHPEPPTSRLSLGDHHHHDGHNVTVNPSNFIGLKPSNYASSSSGPVEMEAQQRPCKRKADELSIGQSSSGVESSNILQRPEGSSSSSSSVWQSVSENPTPTSTMPFDPIIPRLGSGIRGISGDNRAIENIRRNVRLRINNSRQQNQLPASNGLLSFSSPYASLGLNPAAATSSSSRESQPMLRVPALTRNLHVSSRTRSSNRPVSSNIIGGSRDNSRTTPTVLLDHPSFVQPDDIGNTVQTAINLDLDSVGGNGTNLGPHRDAFASNPMPNMGPHRASSLYRSRRNTEIIRRSLLSSIDSRIGSGGGGGQNSNLFSRIPPPVGASASSSSQESGNPPVIAITGHRPHHHFPHLRMPDRQLDGAFGMPYLSRTVAGGSERRGRSVSEIRNVLDLICRGEGLRLEDFMILDQSVLYGRGRAGIHDRYRDMRLDVDNMSYEELLALEERIGNVNTGLTEENVYKHLKQKTYVSQPDDEPCCICQEEYKNGDDLGALDCGHEFHTSCIKQWLLQKNSCPVCKSAASK